MIKYVCDICGDESTNCHNYCDLVMRGQKIGVIMICDECLGKFGDKEW